MQLKLHSSLRWNVSRPIHGEIDNRSHAKLITIMMTRFANNLMYLGPWVAEVSCVLTAIGGRLLPICAQDPVQRSHDSVRRKL
jgi:hypothetical protein